MVVRVRIKLGGVRRKRVPARDSLVAAVRRWSSPASGAALALALWRLGYDLNWTKRFAIPDGLFSHWQLWMALAVLFQVIAAKLEHHPIHRA